LYLISLAVALCELLKVKAAIRQKIAVSGSIKHLQVYANRYGEWQRSEEAKSSAKSSGGSEESVIVHRSSLSHSKQWRGSTWSKAILGAVYAKSAAEQWATNSMQG